MKDLEIFAAALVWAGEIPQGLEVVCLDHNLCEAAMKEGFGRRVPKRADVAAWLNAPGSREQQLETVVKKHCTISA